MELQELYEKLMDYDRLLTNRFRNGRMDGEKLFNCSDKLEEWWKLAQINEVRIV